MSQPDVSQHYDQDFFDELDRWARRSADVVVPWLVEQLRPRSVVDVGCGTGAWLAAFRQAGVTDVLGLDGSYVDRALLRIPADRFRAADLEQGLTVDRVFDLAVSLEVGEHLPPERAAGFVEELTALAPVVVFSAAAPHQGGTHHVNEQWPDYWSALFADAGYEPVDCLRPRLWADDRVAWWYAQNTLIYLSSDEEELLGELRRQPGWHGSSPLRLVHPVRYTEWVEYALAEARARWPEA